MSRNYLRGIVFLVWLIVVLICSGVSFVSCRKPKQSNSNTVKGFSPKEQSLAFIDPGCEEDTSSSKCPQGAFIYYHDTFKELGMNPLNTVDPELTGKEIVDSGNYSIALMLDFLGFKDLTPTELENLPSEELMKRFPDKNLLSSAFFAPKITDVSTPDGTPIKPEDMNVGWRKIIRLKAQKDSKAERKGIAAGFFLFNKFQGKNHSIDPFEPREGDTSNESKNTQLILIRAPKQTGLSKPAYFFMYEAISAEGKLQGKLKTFLNASFDLGKDNPKDERYYVPIACAQCHGGLRKVEPSSETSPEVPDDPRMKLNYLDTDHWFDRTADDDDFAFLKKSPFGIIYDGCKDKVKGCWNNEEKENFEAAFNIIRWLNEEIRDQNKLVELNPNDPKTFTFQLRAVLLWLDLHKDNNVQHQNIFVRALDPPTGSVKKWDASREVDAALLPLLNQYCVRCHSSVKFNVFDKSMVFGRRGTILKNLDRDPADRLHMPQDRELGKGVKENIENLIKKLKP